MPIDYSKFSDEDLVALKNNDYSSMSDTALLALKESTIPNVSDPTTLPEWQYGADRKVVGTHEYIPSVGLQRATAVTQGLSRGFSDELQGILEGIAGVAEGRDFSEAYKEGRAVQRTALKTAFNERPWETLGLTAAGGIAGGNLSKTAETVLGRMGQAAAGGAVVGVGFGEQESIEGRIQDLALGAGVGVVASLGVEVAGKLLHGAKNLFRSSKPQAESAALLGEAQSPANIVDVRSKLENIRDHIQSAKIATDKYVDDLYDVASQSGDKARITLKGYSFLRNRLDSLKEGAFGTAEQNLYNKAGERINQAYSETGQFSVKDMVSLVKDLRKERSVTSDASVKHAAGKVIEAVDDMIREAEKGTNWVVGDKAALTAYQKATKAWQASKDRFSPTKKLPSGNYGLTKEGKVIIEAIDEKATAEEVGALMFGNGSVANNKHASRTYEAVLNAVDPVDRDIVRQEMKQAIVSKLFQNNLSSEADESIKILGLARDIQSLRVKNPSLFSKFSESEQEMLKALESSLQESMKMNAVGKALEHARIFLARSGMRINIPLVSGTAPSMPIDKAAAFMTKPLRPSSGVGESALTGAASTEVLAQPRK